jgi:hypothetical protein
MKVFLTTHEASSTDSAVFKEIAHPLVVHERGWGNLQVVNNAEEADSVVKLTPGDVMAEMFPQFAKKRLSACDMRSREVWINEDRWFRHIPDESQLPLAAYRAYVLQHELGHALGKQHAKCTPPGPVPVMVQQTVGIGGCTPNPFPTPHERSQPRND